MAFSLDTHWVWDFWVADDGDTFHLYYLHAPKSLGDPELRHRSARIGHATSEDLTNWVNHGEVLRSGPPGSFDETATWTGSVVRGADGVWRMFYTGASFLSEDTAQNIESIGMATSSDLHHWSKRDGFVLRADPKHYEKFGDSDWPEEAWRDPWVFEDPSGTGWHMLVTARGKGATGTSGGVVGHAWSPDLDTWEIRPPLGKVSEQFPHLEVLQYADVDGEPVLFFSGPRFNGDEGGSGVHGVWAVAVPDGLERVDVDTAQAATATARYAGRMVRDRSGTPVLLSFIGTPGSDDLGGITDPVAIDLWARA